jgi:hypothetical protein
MRALLACPDEERGARYEIEFHRPKPLQAACRKPGQGPPPLRRIFPSKRDPAGGQCARRVPTESGRGRAFSRTGFSLSVLNFGDF